ncbi:MAG: SMC-Scp complex subunit ScpB [Rothia sp. (in: high G+C Gram-positive bacteria)]|nr:SMC-Scp complex subunit ScpB [Rothia sp. (in: high G+C Gram-positive bacteria)]
MSNENHPDYTPSDLEILLSGSWNPDAVADETVAETTLETAEETIEGADSAQEPQTAPASAEPDELARVELLPGGVKASIEAILAVVDQPVSARELSAALIVSEATIEKALDDLSREYNGYDDGEQVHEPRGYELRQVGGGWRLYSRSTFSPWVAKFVGGKSTAKLSKSVMETLTVVAYQQPVTRNYVAGVRGVNIDAAFRTLRQRGLIAETVPDSETGAHQFVTTELLLEKLGINSLDELPPLAPFLPDLDDLELSGENP